MLIANSLAIAGRHQALLEPTSLAVSRGELLLVQAEPQPTRTALALGLSARMRPTAGSVSWSGNSTLRAVRRISTLVDSPEINEPEAHLKVRDLVAEDLALQPGPLWRRSSINAWMERHKLDHLADSWLDAINPLDRLALITHLSLEDHRTELAVFDSPDRHGIPEGDWVNHLQVVAGGRRAPAVIAIVTRIPAEWDGAVAYAGHQQEHPVFAQVLEPADSTAWEQEPLPGQEQNPEPVPDPAPIPDAAAPADVPVSTPAPAPAPRPATESTAPTEPAAASGPAAEISPALEETR